jgi:hypothetical protein
LFGVISLGMILPGGHGGNSGRPYNKEHYPILEERLRCENKMKFHLTILILFVASHSFGQRLMFDTTRNFVDVENKSYYYSKTDFRNIDTLKLWSFAFEVDFEPEEPRPVKTIGRLVFWRTRPIYEVDSQSGREVECIPSMSFDVFSISDTDFCYRSAYQARVLSSAVPPVVGGDILVFDKYVFLSIGGYSKVSGSLTHRDYARPVVNYLFSKLDKSRVNSIQDLLKQFGIEERKLERSVRREPR